MSDLNLHVKTEYFEAIKRGEKNEEYRLHTGYWVKRLVEMPSGKKREFGNVVIHNAYMAGNENRLTFPWHGWILKTIMHPHFGPAPVTVFAIKLEK